MNKKEIFEYNKRCAEFLDLHRDEEVAIYKMTAYPYDFLKFHSDWNWIMEVVEAIEKLGYNRRVDIDSSHVLIQYKEWYTLVQKDSKKEAVVQAINQFLIWYNENSSQNRQ